MTGSTTGIREIDIALSYLHDGRTGSIKYGCTIWALVEGMLSFYDSQCQELPPGEYDGELTCVDLEDN